MAKNIIQDVMVKNRRSIRQISIDRGRRPIRNETRKIETDDYEEKMAEPQRVREKKENKKRNAPKMIIWAIALLSLIFLLFSITSFFSTATVTIIPKVAPISLDDSYIARKNALPGELQYEVMTLQKKMSKRLDATETSNSQIKASGKIMIYNNFSAAPQRLIVNTRFESGKGLIYKISDSVVVPGARSVGGKKVPGSIEALVFADEPGENFNMKVSDLKGDFKIPGLKGDKKYNYFYARIKTDIAGGSSGLVKKVPAKILSAARDELRASIKSELLKDAYATKPQSSILFSNAYYVDYAYLPDSSLGADKVEISESATLYGIIFDEAKLSSYVAKKKLSDYDGSPVHLVLGDNAVVGVSNDTKIKPWESNVLNLSLKGNANIIWTYDEAALKKSIAGFNNNDINKFLSSHPGIKEARLEIRPFWKRSLPSDPQKIKIRNSIVEK
ncbi:MAG: hypothetical protein KGJ58_01585 [Patescibacteria group bacterium]|nr:hypothetical protein [Patescibacteria group bacterium]MDE1988568.1 hypothetical protein [Patescibacteria group bacterium]MDE2218130.1 hypothetical protein [Patescibacteria group bacterium]